MKTLLRITRSSLLASFAITASLAGAPASAQDRTSEIDEIFSWATPETPGAAVAVSLHGNVIVNRVYGLAKLEGTVGLTTDTVFDIGSVQKQFVAAAVLLLADEGRISLDDDIREHFPELPDYGHTITVDHLLTHTSGVRDWVGLMKFSRDDEEALTMILRQRGLNFAPGTEWSYSNSGYVLLKELVARVSGMPFAAFARSRLFEPLGMTSTTYASDVRAVENHALAYEREDDGWRLDVMLGKDRGGGAVLSTAGDLLIWNEALTNARLGAFVSAKIQEPARLNSGRQLDYARGLFLDSNRGGKVVWHGGSARAYKALLARYPEQGLSIAILSNAGDSGVRTQAARRIFDLFVPATEAPDAASSGPAATADGAGTDGIDLTSKAGLFFSERTGQPLRLIVQEGRLRTPGGPALVTLNADHFRNPEGELGFMSQDEFELRFVTPNELELVSMEGETTRYRRAQPYAPTSSELQAFAGRYESDELRATLEIETGPNGMTGRLNGSPPFEFAPIDRDTFQLARMTIRFRRDGEGTVVGLDYSNPVLRNITFTRASD